MYENLEQYFVELTNPCYANTLRRFFTDVSMDENWCLLRAPCPQVTTSKAGLMGSVFLVMAVPSCYVEAWINRLLRGILALSRGLPPKSIKE